MDIQLKETDTPIIVNDKWDNSSKQVPLVNYNFMTPVTLSACLIVKNEEKSIEKILQCLLQFCDEVNIVDTGSNDKTVEILQRYSNNKVKIYHLDWRDDFSYARNYSFSKATMEYIFWCDGDDYIPESSIDEIKILKASGELRRYDIVSADYVYGFNGGDKTELRRDCFLRRSLNFQWTGRIHEYVSSPLANTSYYDHDIKIEHHKYKDGTSRNLKIFAKMIKDKVEFTSRDIFYFGNELYFGKKYQRALAEYENFLKKDDAWYVDKLTALWRMHIMYSQVPALKDEEKDNQILAKSLFLAPPRPDFCCAIGDYHLKRNDVESAIFWYKTAYVGKENNMEGDFYMLVAKSYGTWYPLLQLCVCYYRLGKVDEAIEANELAAYFDKDNESVKYNRKFFNGLKDGRSN